MGKTHDPNELLRGHRDRIKAQVKEIGEQVRDLSSLKKLEGLTTDQEIGRKTLERLGDSLYGAEHSTARDMSNNAERSVDREQETKT